MDFLSQRERGVVSCKVFLLSPLQSTSSRTVETVRGCVSLKKYKSQGKAVETTMNSKEKKLSRLLSGFRPRIRPLVSTQKVPYGC